MPVERMRIVNAKETFTGLVTGVAGQALCAVGIHSWARGIVWSKKYDGKLVEHCGRPECQIVRGVWSCTEGGKPVLTKDGKIIFTIFGPGA